MAAKISICELVLLPYTGSDHLISWKKYKITGLVFRVMPVLGHNLSILSRANHKAIRTVSDLGVTSAAAFLLFTGVPLTQLTGLTHHMEHSPELLGGPQLCIPAQREWAEIAQQVKVLHKSLTT